MALNGTLNTTDYKGRYVRFDWSATQNTDNNSSTITWIVTGAGNASSSWYTTGPVYVTINGQLSAFASYNRIRLYDGTVVGSGTRTIYHNNDGTLNLSVKIQAAINTSTVNCTGENTFALDVIARPTTPSFSSANVDMGSSITINLPRNKSNLTHNLKYSFGALTEQISGLTDTTGVETSTSFIPPVNLASQIPNATSANCYVICETYEGSNLIGTRSATITLNVPSSVVPTITEVNINDVRGGITEKFHAYVQNRSQLMVDIVAEGAYDSSIKSYTTKVLNSTYYGRQITSALIYDYGTVNVTCTVVDSRGRTATSVTSVTVLQYESPIIRTASVRRIDVNGNDDPNGTRIAVSASFDISPVNNLNDKLYRWKFKIKGDSNYTTIANGNDSYVYRKDLKLTSSPAVSPDEMYSLRLEIQDYFQISTYDFELSTSFSIFDVNESGKGLAFGKSSAKDKLEVAMASEFTKNIDIYNEKDNTNNSKYIDLYQKSGTKTISVTTADNGEGLKIHVFNEGSETGTITINSDGSVRTPKYTTHDNYFTYTSDVDVLWCRIISRNDIVTINALVSNKSALAATNNGFPVIQLPYEITPGNAHAFGVTEGGVLYRVEIVDSGIIKVLPMSAVSAGTNFSIFFTYNRKGNT